MAKYTKKYPFSSLIICAKCGRTLKRRYWNYGYPSARIMQQCGSYIEGKGNCDAKAVYQEVLEGATLQMLNEVFIKNIDIMAIIKDVINKNIQTTDVDKDLETAKEKKAEIEALISNLIDMKMKTPSFDDAAFNNKYAELKTSLYDANLEIIKLENEYINVYDSNGRIATINKTLHQYKQQITEINTDILRAFVYKIIAVEQNEIIFCIAGRKKYTDKEFVERRQEFVNYDPIATGNYYYEKYKQTMNYKVIII